ncbi:MAG: hypothetical protein JXB32_12365 [Deltaproteobacteria bacterium]|nr:hypothetical protein [Deltaproteobacteria bacterium]
MRISSGVAAGFVLALCPALAGGAVPRPFQDPRQPPAVAELPAIRVTLAEMNERVARVVEGATPAEVRATLGGTEHETRDREATTVRFWRFRIVDAADAQSAYQIWMGEFENDRLTFGTVLPQG